MAEPKTTEKKEEKRVRYGVALHPKVKGADEVEVAAQVLKAAKNPAPVQE